MCDKTKKFSRWLSVALVATLFGVMSFWGHSYAAAGINQQISFEGKVVNANGVNVPDGTYNMEFKIYQDGTNTGSGSTLKWTEDRLVSSSTAVTVTAGTFQVNLGAVTAFGANVDWNQSVLWLSMNIGGTGSTASWDGEMTPYIRLTSVPYAMNAGTVGGLSASQLVQLSPSTPQNGTLNVSGTATVGSLTVGSTSVVSSGGLLQSAAVSGSYNGITGVGTVTVGTWNASTLNAAYGGTGQSSYTVGDLLYASSSTALSKLSDVASGSCLTSGGTGVAPTWGSCGSASSGANTALSNLAGVAINTSLLPGTTNAIDAGSSALALRSGYFATSVYAPQLDGLAAGSTLNIAPTNSTTLNIGPTGSSTVASVINIGSSTAAAEDINIGGNGSAGGSNINTTSSLQGGTSMLTTASTGITAQTSTNSTSAFQVQNSAGASILQVDTTSTTASGSQLNYLTYPGFESGSFSNANAGWVATGGSTLTQNTSKTSTYNGIYSAKVVTTTGASPGITTSSFAVAPPINTYLISFYAQPSVAMASSAFTVTSTDGATHTCSPVAGTTLVTSGFTRVFCSLTTTGPMTALAITQNDATARTIYIDAVQVQTTTFNATTLTTPTTYQVGAIQLRGTITNPVSILNNGDSTSEFQILSSSAQSLLTVDSINKVIQVGSATANTNNTLLSLNNYANGTTEPTVVNGSMYYNSALGAFRCGVAGAWRNCVNGIAYTVSAVSGATSAITNTAAGNIMIAPLYIPGQITINTLRIAVTTATGTAGDVGIYNSAGTLVLNGGSSSLTTVVGAKAITPVQTGANRILEPGQYYAAITWNSTTGGVAGASIGTAGIINRAGTLTGGGLVLPGSIVLANITNAATEPQVSFNN